MSAYKWWLIFSKLEINLLRGCVYKINTRGPRTEPWGTPNDRGIGDDKEPFILTDWFRPDIYDLNQFKIVLEKPNHEDKQSNNLRWSIVSKAAERSSKTSAVGRPCAKFKWISLQQGCLSGMTSLICKLVNITQIIWRKIIFWIVYVICYI